MAITDTNQAILDRLNSYYSVWSYAAIVLATRLAQIYLPKAFHRLTGRKLPHSKSGWETLAFKFIPILLLDTLPFNGLTIYPLGINIANPLPNSCQVWVDLLGDNGAQSTWPCQRDAILQLLKRRPVDLRTLLSIEMVQKAVFCCLSLIAWQIMALYFPPRPIQEVHGALIGQQGDKAVEEKFGP